MNRQLTKLSLVALLICLFSGLAYAQEPSGYYKKAEGKSQKELLKQLCEIVGPHKNVGYNGLWNVYKDSDIRPGTNYYWDMYSTSKFREGQQKCGNYSHVGDCVNREHSFPKSWFKEGQPMVSDAFHIYPTDGKVNGQRSNFPYGECANGTTLPSCNGVDALGKLGKSTFPGYSGTVFEPVDEYKGDFARSYFYMAACYNDKIASWSSPMLAGNSYPCYTTWAVNLLLKWNEQDPVSQKEIDRNNAVYKRQNNRNPFIDHPELAEYIWGDKQNIGWTPGGVVDPKITSPYNGSTVDGIPALSASNVTADGFTARWVDVDKNGGDYTLNVYLADGTTLVPGFPKTVKAAAQQYAVTDLEYLTEYKYQLSNVKGMKSNLVSVTTVDLDREISFDLPEGGLVLSAAPGVDSAPVKVTVYASNVEENEIDVSVTKGFQVSADKSDWRSSLAVDTKTAETIGAEIYVRIPASAAGTYDGTLSASTATVEGDDVDVKAVVTAPVTFFEDFEKPGAGPYNTFNYNGSACKWSVVNAGIAAREGDKVHGTQALCTGKKGERSLTMLEDKVDGAGEVSFFAAPYGSDAAPVVELSYSVDHGSNWIKVKEFSVDDKSQLVECSATINASQPVRIRLNQVSGGRLNIDDIGITAFVSSVAAVGADAEWDAYCRDGKLVVETANEADIHVYTVDAREACCTTVSGSTTIALPAGYYIVVNGDDSRKVAIK